MDYIFLVFSFLFDHVPAICNAIQEIIELFRLYSDLVKKKEPECEKSLPKEEIIQEETEEIFDQNGTLRIHRTRTVRKRSF
ncbi:MAG: hypothetical protein ACLSX0_01050 [Anaerostipes caccae]|jgi:hypothetical protein